ncbi:SAM-dependent methyltransferase [Macromonas nakdongensis]|uniref:SAM-dependent methyltransferase n=1 Tax=Macromonas nakdongensis TaxID=1843082 RepID=UPI000C33B0BC|nr:SAM-dependent methyltransferase [Macromonas nakdongensis]
MSAPRLGTLYLVPTPLDFGCNPQDAGLDQVLPAHTWQVAARLGHWITENAKSTRAFLKRVDAHSPLAAPLQALQITELPRQVHKKGDHDPAQGFDARPLLAAALAGHDIGLVSEAGMPAIADPGASVVRAAHALGLAVVPLVGPISLMLALAASGLNGQNFAFVGYLPQDAAARAQRLRELEQLAQHTGQTQLWIETPYRNEGLLQATLGVLKPQTRLAVAVGMTLPEQRVHSASVADWKRQGPAPLPLGLPAVFLIGR